MDPVIGYSLVSVTGVVTTAGVAAGTWWLNARHAKAIRSILTKTPPCIDCGQPTESPRLVQCDRCHARSCAAAFTAHAASLGINIDKPRQN